VDTFALAWCGRSVNQTETYTMSRWSVHAKKDKIQLFRPRHSELDVRPSSNEHSGQTQYQPLVNNSHD
jgi:hypothetical protein